MKSAKDTLNEYLINMKSKDGYDTIIDAMIFYAAAACKEQREMCAKEYMDNDDYQATRVEKCILNAPQPQLL